MCKQNIQPEQSDAPLAYRVAHFCRAIGIGRTKFYELDGPRQNQNGYHRRPSTNPGCRSAAARPRWLRVMRRSLDFSVINAAALPDLPALSAR